VLGWFIVWPYSHNCLFYVYVYSNLILECIINFLLLSSMLWLSKIQLFLFRESEASHWNCGAKNPVWAPRIRNPQLLQTTASLRPEKKHINWLAYYFLVGANIEILKYFDCLDIQNVFLMLQWQWRVIIFFLFCLFIQLVNIWRQYKWLTVFQCHL
jgi:hypothetical protein